MKDGAIKFVRFTWSSSIRSTESGFAKCFLRQYAFTPFQFRYSSPSGEINGPLKPASSLCDPFWPFTPSSARFLQPTYHKILFCFAIDKQMQQGSVLLCDRQANARCLCHGRWTVRRLYLRAWVNCSEHGVGRYNSAAKTSPVFTTRKPMSLGMDGHRHHVYTCCHVVK